MSFSSQLVSVAVFSNELLTRNFRPDPVSCFPDPRAGDRIFIMEDSVNSYRVTNIKL